MKAAVLTSLFGGLFAQIVLRLLPLTKLAAMFPAPNIYWLITVIAAILSVCVYFGGMAFSKRNKCPVWVSILIIGAFLVVAVIVIPGGVAGMARPYPPSEFILSAVELAICSISAALLGNFVST